MNRLFKFDYIITVRMFSTVQGI